MQSRDTKTASASSSGVDSVAEEIAAEVADHLTAAADELEKEGIIAADARQEAIRQFGDIRAVEKSCYWIWQGESIMFRWSMVVLLSLLVIALGVTAVGSWRVQSQVAGQVVKMSEELANLAKTQEALQRQQGPLEIVGQIYRGDKSHPVANAEVVLTRVGDGEVIRRISTDDRGRYRTGRLAAGDYSVVTQKVYTVNDHAPLYSYFANAQGPPIYLYSGDGTANGDLDIGDPPIAGPIRVELSHPLPTKEVPGKYRLQSAVSLDLCSARLKTSIWTSSFELPKDWPIFCGSSVATTPPPRGGYALRSLHGARNFLTMDQFRPKKDAPLTTAVIKDAVPAGECYIIARILVDIEPLATSGDKSTQGGAVLPLVPFTANWADRFSKKLGSAWAHRLVAQPLGSGRIPTMFSREHDKLPQIDLWALVSYSYVPNEEAVVAHLTGAERLLKVDIPEDLEERLCQILDAQVEEPSEDRRLAAIAQLKELLSQPAKITFTGVESP